jgi:putative transposase
MSSNRMHYTNTVHFITNRCEHEMMFLLPTDRTTETIQSWFARALCLFGQGIEIYAFIFLSNHFHILVRDTKGTLAAFMCYFQANVAKAINKELGRKGRFWSREYDDVIVDGDDAFLDRYAYVVANAVKAGLVNRADEWTGWNSLGGALGNGEYCFEMLNRTKLHNATRRGQKVDPTRFTEEWSFELSVPPMLAEKTETERRRFIRQLVTGTENMFHEQRNNKPPLGVENILRQRPTDRPKTVSFRPRIKFFCLDAEHRHALIDAYRTFVGAYKGTLHVFRNAAYNGRRPVVEWPEGSYPPSCFYPVGSLVAG